MTRIQKEIDLLASTVDPKAKVPKGFGLWSDKMILAWLRQNQRKEKK